jgi:hypothetical protein
LLLLFDCSLALLPAGAGAAACALSCDLSFGQLQSRFSPCCCCCCCCYGCCCSLALLPAGAQQHVPSAVAHLMDSSSPIYDMYASCEGCEAAAQEAYVAQRAYDVSVLGLTCDGVSRV